MIEPRKTDVLRRLRTARGHLEAVIRMVEEDSYCVDVMKQIAGVRSALARVSQIELRNHFENCFAQAIRQGNEGPAIDELLSALAFDKSIV
ncbi:MAG: metal-sensitive transcriptional regulator [Vulcanimicrobiaceae bacterium]